jgi:RNA polymerase sigma-70 factor (ECF subfamily)
MAVRDASPTTRERAFANLIRAHQASVWRYLRFLGCDEARADDLVQETFLAVWKRPFEDRGSPAARAYLRRVARNLFLMEVRRRRARPLFTDLAAADEVWIEHDEDDGEAYRAALEKCLDTLAERVRRALEMFYRQGAGRSRIGEALGMTVDGVKTMMRRAREALRGCILGRLRP